MKADTCPSPTRRVTDAPTRMFHGLFALCFTGAYFTSESERVKVAHATFGYTMAALLLFRLLYGWLGPRSVRWSSIITKLKSGWVWCRNFQLQDLSAAYLRSAQNFALVVATSGSLILAVPLILSGHVLYVGTSDWLESAHEMVANIMLLLVLAHLGLLVLIGVLRDTNLAMSMWRGRVPGAGPDLVAAQRVWLAWVLLMISSAFGLWSAL